MNTVVGEVAERWVYPVKGMAGCLLPDDMPMEVDEFGVVGSRRWMVVDENGRMVNSKQNGIPELLTIKTELLEQDRFVLDDECELSFEPENGSVLSEVYMDGMQGFIANQESNEWISALLGYSGLRFIRFDPSFPRQVHEEKAWKGNAPRAFVDSAPFHVINEATTQEASKRFGPNVRDHRRYRPDLVFRGAVRAEDNWTNDLWLVVGGVVFKNIRPLDRCPLPTINPDDPTGPRDPQVSRMFSVEFKNVTPQSLVLRPCFGVGVDVSRTGQIHQNSKLILV